MYIRILPPPSQNKIKPLKDNNSSISIRLIKRYHNVYLQKLEFELKMKPLYCYQ